MNKIQVKDILLKLDVKLICGDENLSLENFCIDTRKLKKGDTFVAIKTDVIDGNNYYQEAFDKGAKICVLDNKDAIKEKRGTIILVSNTILFLQKLAEYKLSLRNVPLIAITGSVGKTTTKDMIASVLSKKYKVLKNEGNLNNAIGFPLTVLRFNDEDIIVTEMGMNSLGEISVLSKIGKPSLAIITNVGTAHIGKLGSRENILKAKLEILDGLRKDGKLLINNDNDLLHKVYPSLKERYNVITVGINNDSDYKTSNIKEENNCNTFLINGNKININILGDAFVYNSLIAYAVGDLYNVDISLIKEALNSYLPSYGRGEVISGKKGIKIVNDAYNANIDSMKLALKQFNSIKAKRKIICLADMLELGDYTKSIHEDLGREILKYKFDKVILIGEYSKETLNVLYNNNYNKENVRWFKSSLEVIPYLDEILQSGDYILFKGSLGMNLLPIVDILKGE